MNTDKITQGIAGSMLNTADDSIVSPAIALGEPVTIQTFQIQPTNTSSKAKEILQFVTGMKIEVVMILYAFSSSLRTIPTNNLIVEKVCMANLNFEEEVCSYMHGYSNEYKQASLMANTFILGRSLIALLPGCVLCAFTGSWSDKYGRKPFLILALAGIILDGLATTISAAVLNSRAEYAMVIAVFSGMSGGEIGVLTAVYSHASDVTTFGQRAIKYATIQMAYVLSRLFGLLVGFRLENNYIPTFLLSTAGHAFALLWVLFVLKESKGLDNLETWTVKFRNLFSLTHLIDTVKASLKTRPNKGMVQLLLLIVAMSITFLWCSPADTLSTTYILFTYDWDAFKTYDILAIVFPVIGTIAMLIVVAVFLLLKLGDAVLGIVGNASLFARYMVMGFAMHPAVYIVSQLLGLLGNLATVAGRSRISKIASKDEGKVFAFLSAAETLLPILGMAIANRIFDATLTVFPGVIFIVVAIMMVYPILIFVWLFIRFRNVNYEETPNNQ